MSTKTNSKTNWVFPTAGQAQDALWGAALTLPPMGTPRNDVLKGNSGVNGFYGLGGNDTIYGYGGTDALAGGAGNDKLYGGAGTDHFFFDAKLNAKTNVDRIMDFNPVDDVLGLSKSIFSKITRGPLKEAAFHNGKKAHDADDRIVYDTKTGNLYYDPDGTGSKAKIKFAVLANKAALTYEDIVIS